MIRFQVPGDPTPQPRPRVSTRGGFARAYVPSRHPVHAYRQAVAIAARVAGMTALADPIRVTVSCVFRRPKSHMTSKGVKASAPRCPRPDCDNLAKAVLDALAEFFDDSLVTTLVVHKAYGDLAHTEVVIE